MNRCLFGEYPDASSLLAAIAALRARGHRVREAYTPYPVPGLDEALARPPSPLPWLVFAVGIGACAGAYALQWLLNASLYPLNVGHRPPHYPLSFVPISFEMGILFASLTAFGALFAAGRLLRLYDPVFDVEGFESVTQDAFWLRVTPGREDDGERAERAMRDSGARQVVALERRRA